MANDSQERAPLRKRLAEYMGGLWAAAAPAKAPASSGSTGKSGKGNTLLPPPNDAKAPKGQQSVSSFLRTPTAQQQLPQLDRSLATTDITTLRASTTPDVIRSYIAASPDLSAAVFAYLRTAITGYRAVAKDRDGTFNRDATNVLQQIIARLDVLPDYKLGYNETASIRSLSEQLGKQLMQEGACASELVLDKARLPSEIAPIAVSTIKFGTDGQRKTPFQRIGGTTVDLDIPTFFYTTLDQDLLEPYASSPLEAAIQPVVFAAEFQNDLRRIVKKAIHPRVKVVVDQEKLLQLLPAEAAHDEQKRRDFITKFIADIEAKINDLKPEDALVYLDSLDIGYITAGNTNHDKEIETLSGVIDAKVATGAKTMPSILGHGSGSQNIASVETMLFMKSAGGAIQAKLAEHYSRVLTLAVRLFGFDSVVTFEWETIDLRPDAELEAFKTMKQSRVLELLSLGMITDEEACLQLTGSLPPQGYEPKMGTNFFNASNSAASAAGGVANKNGFSNNSSGGNDGGAGNRRPGGNPPQKSKGSQAA